MSAKSGIYAIRNSNNGKLYVGSSVNLNARRKQHFSDLRCRRHSNQHLQRAFNRYGEEAFFWEVLQELPASELLSAEKSWFESTNCCSPDSGYNMVIHPEAPTRGRKVNRQKPGPYGECHGNSKLTSEAVVKIKAMRDAGRTQKEIAEALGVSQSNVSIILLGKGWTHLGIGSYKPRKSRSGATGVYKWRDRDSWWAEIRRNGRRHHLGSFPDFASALAARKAAEEASDGI